MIRTKRLKVAIGSTAAALILSVGITGCGSSPSSGGAASTSSGNAAPPAITVTAEQYNKDYQANEVTADNKYKDKTIEITGKVKSIDKDFADKVYITLSPGDNDDEDLGVQVHLQNVQDGASLAKEQQVTFVGTGDGLTMQIPSIKDATIKK